MESKERLGESPLQKHDSGEIAVVYFVTASALYVFFLSDFINKVLRYLHFDFARASLMPRAFFEFLFLIVIFFCLNARRAVFSIILVLTLAAFFCGQIVLSINTGEELSYIENILLFNKYYFIFIIYFAIYKLKDFREKLFDLVKIMERLFLLNAFLVLVGFFLKIELFRTYIRQMYRFGYSGVVEVQNEATLMCFVGLSYFYYKRFEMGERSIGFIVVLSASLLLGTKGIYLYLLMLLCFHFFYHSGLKAKLVTMGLASLVLAVISLILNLTAVKNTVAYFSHKMSTEGIWYALFSGRNRYLEEKGGDILSEWSLVNYFFGGQNLHSQMIEMDFFDLFFFFGYFGFSLFFILLFTTIFKLNYLKPFNFFFVFSYLVLAFLGGHFFSSVINALYVCLLGMYFQSTQAQVKR